MELSRGLIGVDTNVVLRAVLQDDEKHTPIAARLFRSLTRENPGFLTQVTLAEVYWVLSRGLKLSRLECLRVVRALIQNEALEFDDVESVVRALHLAEGGADFADALIEGTMQLFGVTETVTFDRDAAATLGWRDLTVEA